MNKAELKILEKVYEAEVSSAIGKTSPIFQTKSKLAEKLCTEGFLQKTSENIRFGNFPATISGFVLTHAGRLAYCLSC